MGSYHNIVKTEEIRKKVEIGDLAAAQEILDTIDLRKIKNSSDLNLFAEVYMENERYDESAELYLKVYEKSKTRKTTGQMITVSIKRGNQEDASYYLEQYKKISPEDFEGYIYQYKVDKMNGVSYEHQIKSLENLKKIEYTEKWAYELAKLYYKAGMEQECIRECSDIILWFGEGVYVEKAKMLRSYFLGETEKDKMMEELKKRSLGSLNIVSAQHRDEVPEVSKDKGTSSASVFMPENNETVYEDGLDKNIRDVMKEERFEYQQEDLEAEYEGTLEAEPEYEQGKTVYTGYEDEHTEDGYTEYEDELTEDGYTGYEDERAEEGYAENEKWGMESYSYVAENIEAVLYSGKSEEEILDEESLSVDTRLNHLEEELQINLEEIFKDFLTTDSIKVQIADCLENIIRNESASVVMISSEAAGKTTLARDLALFLYKTGKLKTPKLAKITASKFNVIDLDSKKETLRNCCIIIEEAGELKKPAIEKLLELILQMQGEIAVIFEIKTMDTDKLLKVSPLLKDIVQNRIYLP